MLRLIPLDRFLVLMVGGIKFVVSSIVGFIAPWLDMLMTCIDDEWNEMLAR
jgi:hypothetical protein